jgi:hypothetical protein
LSSSTDCMAVVAVAVLQSVRMSDYHVDPHFLVTGCPRSWSALVASYRRCEIWTDPQASCRKPPTSNPCPEWRGSKSSATSENRVKAHRPASCKALPPINLLILQPLFHQLLQSTQADADNLEMLRAFNNMIHLLLKHCFWTCYAHCSTCCCNPCSINCFNAPKPMLTIWKCFAHHALQCDSSSAQVPLLDALRPLFNMSLQPCSIITSTHPSRC